MMRTDAVATRRDGALLALVLLGFVALWGLYPQHLLPSDPWIYSELAYAITQGLFLEGNPDNIIIHRLGTTLPLALIYKLFGVSIKPTNLWPLICALLSLVIIWFALPNRTARLVGVALCITNPVFFKMSVNLYPDISAATFMTLSALFLAQREQWVDRKNAWIYPVLAVACVFFAFLSKLSAYWLLPVWLVVFLGDAKRGRGDLLRGFHAPFALAGAVIGSLYLIYNEWAWGHPLVRLLNVSDVVESSLWSITRPNADITLVNRLTGDAVAFLLHNYGVVLVPALCAVFVVPKRLRVWSLLTVVSVLLFWFGTTSLTSYQPMPLEPRMLLPALPSACILSGYLVANVKLPAFAGPMHLNRLAACVLVGVSVFFSMGTSRAGRTFTGSRTKPLRSSSAILRQVRICDFWLYRRTPEAWSR